MHKDSFLLLWKEFFESFRVGPNKLFRDNIFGNISKIFQVGTFFKSDVHTVSKANFLTTHQFPRIHSERVALNSSASMPAAKHFSSKELGRSQREVMLIDLGLLLHQLFEINFSFQLLKFAFHLFRL